MQGSRRLCLVRSASQVDTEGRLRIGCLGETTRGLEYVRL